MLVPKRILEGTVKAASTDPTRLQLNGIQLSRTPENGTKSQGRAQATDGKILIRTDWDESPWDEFPDSGVDTKPEDDFSIILPSDHAKRLAKTIPKKQHKSILENLAVNELPSPTVITVGRKDLESTSTEKVPLVDGEFPDCDYVFNGLGDVEATFDIQPVQMIRAMEALIISAGETKTTWEGVVEVKAHAKNRPMTITHKTPVQTTTMLIMPWIKD